MRGEERVEWQVDDRVAVQHEEVVVAEERRRVLDRAAGIEQRVLRRVHDAHPQRVAAAERRAQRIALMVKIDDHVDDSVAPQQEQVVFDERPPVDVNERLRTIECQRSQPGPETRGENHRFHDEPASARSGQGSAANSSARPPGSAVSAMKRRAVATTSGRNASGAGFSFASATY